MTRALAPRVVHEQDRECHEAEQSQPPMTSGNAA
jgi:hypothetical protein